MNEEEKQTIRKIRVKLLTADKDYLYVLPVGSSAEEVMKVKYHVRKENDEFDETVKVLWHDARLNLLDVKRVGPNEYVPSFMVLEPDYLLDISSLAECYKDYGNHPVNYLLNRLEPTDNARPLLLGNIANLFLDEWIHAGKQSPDFISCMKKAFRMYPIELAACEELLDGRKEKEFAKDCRVHFEHIRRTVEETFAQSGYELDRNDAVLEPSYICEALGIQGRLDYMQRDMSSFIEMKSGRADEMTVRGKVIPKENNRTQMLLYLAVLEFSMNHNHRHTHPYLLYTRYPLLYPSRGSWGDVKKIINLRNLIVANEYQTQARNDMVYTKELLGQINPVTLNVRRMHGRFWENYLKPTVNRFGNHIAQLSEIEKSYFYTLYNFITKELYISKSGSMDYYGRTGASALWLSSLAEKKEAGEILYNLKLTDNKASEERHPYVTLSIPPYDELFMPNFRSGDVVVLYERNSDADNATNKLVFKGSIDEITDAKLRIRLRFSQRNLSVFPPESYYAIEHDSMDTSFRGMYMGLVSFLQANPDRRDLLLSQRVPRFDVRYDEAIRSAENVFERMALKADAAKDFFLLVGPPGTGKTSCALRRMVEYFYFRKHQQVLLVAYTNRAVDEICQSISAINPEIKYIRVGSELNCDKRFHDHLLSNILAGCGSRSEVRETICDCRVFVGTVASISMRTELFKLKRFDVAIVDEATQILEPQLLGILCAKFPDGGNAIGKFVLIGDPKQLPAVVLQSGEESEVHDALLRNISVYNLKDSLFERLYRHLRSVGNTRAMDMLCVQGRMHPGVALFPNNAFYSGKLESLGLAHQKEHIDKPVLFIPSKVDSQSPSGKTNRMEARQVAVLAKEIYESDSVNFDSAQTLGVITPYRSQIALIKKELRALNIPELNSISIDTVERYQGSERDNIIYSFSVNEFGQLKWLSNLMEEDGVQIDRKLNVALTRARKRMFIIGVPEILQSDAIYKKLMDSIPWRYI
ncbi:MAG: DEAD/DEAH box helicase [Phocaeicola sp.]|uniref:DEAD/DEAH box helicase n=1 Tax=Phocaeicola TaxID=909656 RepID=UPI00234F95F9|nr:AAA domain-containing protein [Phocaeicola oris]MCE2616337.1 AAA domain-containing protein [Phocaeicola oris]